MLLRALEASAVTPPARRTLPSLSLVCWHAAAAPAATVKVTAALQTRAIGSSMSRAHAAAAAADTPAAPSRLVPPTEPDPSECCGRGCATCVWTTYHEDLLQYNIDLAVQQGRPPPEDPFAALERKLEQQAQWREQEAQQGAAEQQGQQEQREGAQRGAGQQRQAAQQEQAVKNQAGQQEAWQLQDANQQEEEEEEEQQPPIAASLDSSTQAEREPATLPSMPDAAPQQQTHPRHAPSLVF
ncbi:hypothetical protein ACK3TF_002682 [Chlorella vulgaris]